MSSHTDTITELIHHFEAMQKFIKHEYAELSQASSKCAARCKQHGFGTFHTDANDGSFADGCDHAHTERCERSDAIPKVWGWASPTMASNGSENLKILYITV